MLTFAITLAGGFVLALLTIGYTLRLERELERRLEENARARADLQELSARLLRAQENERRTLARELHDEVGQSLSAILMETESAECAEELGEIREHLASRSHAGREDRERGARPGAAVAAFHAGRFRPGSGAQLACPRDDQAHRAERGGVGRRGGRRSARRAQDLHLPPGAGGRQQFARGTPTRAPWRWR